MKKGHTCEGKYRQYEAELLRLRRHFHQYPELAFQETKTSAYIRAYLEKLGYEVTGAASTGLMAELPGADKRKKRVALRAEMDALPIEEQTEVSYASVHPGCMHACGHDGIMASALVIARIMAEHKEDFPVNIRFLFEPAEEIGEGAARMIEEGALKDIDAFVMFHYAANMPFGMAVHEGQASAMIGGMQIHIHGKSSHWCEADRGIDAIYAGAGIVQAVYDINRDYQGDGPCLAGLGMVKGGRYPNIIADYVQLNGNIRACYEQDFDNIKEILENRISEIDREMGTRTEMIFPKAPVLPITNDKELTILAAQAGREVFGEDFYLEGDEELHLSGDNAYRYFREVPGVFCVFLAAPESPCPLHHPGFQLDEDILISSVEALCSLFKKI